MRQRSCSLLVGLLVMMFRFARCASFVLVRTRRTTTTSRWNAKPGRERLCSGRPLFGAIDFDGLMDDVVNRRVSQLSPPAEAAEETCADAGWRMIDWKNECSATSSIIDDEDPSSFNLPPSPVEVMTIGDRVVYMKRDDQLRLPGSQISGNKARKMLSLQRLDSNLFPACVVSHGGPQSNAMVAIAAVVRFHNEQLGLSQEDPQRKRFVYYTKKLPRFLRKSPSGNLFRATSLGMEIVELSHAEYSAFFGSDSGGKERAPIHLPPPVPNDSVFIPQGGACAMAAAGTSVLAREIFDFCSGGGRRSLPWSICIPGGTCSTAVLVHRALREIQSALPLEERLDIQVVVIPCVGDSSYARRQMMALNSQLASTTTDLSTANIEDIPAILPPSPSGLEDYFTFGEPHTEILDTFRKMQEEHDIVLDLLYGAPAWTILLRHLKASNHLADDSRSMLNGRTVLYVHSGGVEGINTQLLRYKHKGLVNLGEIQLPKL